MKAVLVFIAIFLALFALASATEKRINFAAFCKLGANTNTNNQLSKYCKFASKVATIEADNEAEFFGKLKDLYNKWAPKVKQGIDIYNQVRGLFGVMSESDAAFFKKLGKVFSKVAKVAKKGFEIYQKIKSVVPLPGLPLADSEVQAAAEAQVAQQVAFFKKLGKVFSKVAKVAKKGFEIYQKVKSFVPLPGLPLADKEDTVAAPAVAPKKNIRAGRKFGGARKQFADKKAGFSGKRFGGFRKQFAEKKAGFAGKRFAGKFAGARKNLAEKKAGFAGKRFAAKSFAGKRFSASGKFPKRTPKKTEAVAPVAAPAVQA